jgi:hypothetical protein
MLRNDQFLISSSRQIAAVLFSILLGTAASAQAQRYLEAKGVIDFVYYDSDHTNDPVKVDPINFVCVFGTNEWRIDNDYSQNGFNQRYFDGTNVFDRSQITKPAPAKINDLIFKKWGVTPIPFVVAKSNLQINVQTTFGGHPFGNEGVNLPWLVLCSGTYLKLKERLIPPSFGDLPNAVDAYAYYDKTKCFDDTLGLPQTLDLYTSDSLHENSVNQYFYRIRGEKPQHREGFGNDILKFHYEVKSYTNVSGWAVPMEFSFFQNDWRNGTWYLRFRGTGKVLSFEPTGSPSSVLVAGAPQTIVDYRFHSDSKFVNGIVYVITSNTLPATNIVQPIYVAKIAAAPMRGSVSDSKAKWVVGILFLVSSLFLCWLLFGPKPNTNNNNSN